MTLSWHLLKLVFIQVLIEVLFLAILQPASDCRYFMIPSILRFEVKHLMLVGSFMIARPMRRRLFNS